MEKAVMDNSIKIYGNSLFIIIDHSGRYSLYGMCLTYAIFGFIVNY